MISAFLLILFLLFILIAGSVQKKERNLKNYQKVDNEYYNTYSNKSSEKVFFKDGKVIKLSNTIHDNEVNNIRKLIQEDVDDRNRRSGRSVFGRPEWEVAHGALKCDRCGILPLDIKRVFDPWTGEVQGHFCDKCADYYT